MIVVDFLICHSLGYKLSLEGLAVTRTSLVHGPVHTLPTADMYSFLHAKV